MSAYWGTEDKVTAAFAIANMTSSTAKFAPGKPADVKRVIVVIGTANTAAATVTLSVDGTDNGTFTIPANPTVGDVYACDVAKTKDTLTGTSQSADTTLGVDNDVQLSTPGVIEVDVGGNITATFSGGTSGVATLYFEYVEQGNAEDRFDPIAVTYTLS